MMPTYDKLPSGTWRVRVPTDERAPSGRLKTVQGTARTKRDAIELGKRLEAENTPLADRTSVAGFFDRWWAHLATKERAASTTHNYQGHVKNHVVPHLGTRQMASITTEDLNALYAQLLATKKLGKRRDPKTGLFIPTDQDLSPTTVRQVHAILRAAFKQALRWRLVRHNPATLAEPPSAKPHVIKPPAMVDMAAVMAIADRRYGADAACFVRIASATGARRGEMCALRWTDLDAEADTLTIARSWVKVPGTNAEKLTKTKATRTISIDEGTMAVLADRRARAEEVARANFETLRPDGFILSGSTDGAEPWPPDRMSHAWADIRTEAGLPATVRLHDLRHMHLTALLAAGHDLATVAERGGHAGGGVTTLRIYAHGTKDSDRRAADAIGKMLG